MSIAKLDSAKLKKSNLSFTLISTKVLQKITNTDALAIYCYLCSLPADWIIIKEQLKNHFKIGDKKIKNIFSYFVRSNLISYSRGREADGTLTEVEIHLHSGENFNEFEPFISQSVKNQDKFTTGAETDPVVSTGSIIHPVVSHPSGGEALQNIYKNIINKKETKGASRFFHSKDEKQEIRSLVREWKPGNPDYDRFHSYKKSQVMNN